MKRSKGKIPPKETWRYYHRKDKNSPIETAKGNANVIFSSTPDTHRMGLGAEIADLSGSNFLQSKIDFHTRQMVRRWDAFEEDGPVGKLVEMAKAHTNALENDCCDYGKHKGCGPDEIADKMVAVISRL